MNQLKQNQALELKTIIAPGRIKVQVEYYTTVPNAVGTTQAAVVTVIGRTSNSPYKLGQTLTVAVMDLDGGVL